MFDAVFIDADNTLFDFDRTQHHSIHECLEYFSMPHDEQALAYYEICNSEAWTRYNQGAIENDEINEARWSKWLAKYDPEKRVLVEALAARYADNLAQQCEKEDGAEELMQFLLARWPVHIITNGFSSTQKFRWHKAGWAEHLNGITVSADVGVKKPHAGIFEIAMSSIDGCQANRCLMIGDSLEADIAGADQVGMQTCWYQRKGQANLTQWVPHYQVSALTDIIGLF